MAIKIPPALPASKGPTLSWAGKIAVVAMCAISALTAGLLIDLLTDGRDETHIFQTTFTEMNAVDDLPTIAFLGTSRIYHGINPEALDSALERAGCPARSFVFAYPVLSFGEHKSILPMFEADEAHQPDLILVEPLLRAMNRRDSLLRADPLFLLNYYSAYMGQESIGWYEKTQFLERSVRAMTSGSLAAHRLSFVIPQPGSAEPDLVRGYNSYEDGREFDFSTGDWDQFYEQYLAIQIHSIEDQARSYQAALTQRIDAHEVQYSTGQNVAILAMPDFRRSELYHGVIDLWADEAPSRPVINLMDPEVIQHMSNPELWQNASHMSNIGTEYLAEVLAPRLCPLIESGAIYALR